MHLTSKYKIILIIAVWLTLILFYTACEPYAKIAYYNQTSFTIQVYTIVVPYDYQGTPKFNDYRTGDIIKPGESKEYITTVSAGRSVGIQQRYPTQAINQENEVIFYKVFTWDELNEMGWKVVISTEAMEPESSDNTTSK